MAGRLLNLFKVFRPKKKKGPEAGPAQQPEEPEQFQTRQDDASLDGTQAQKPGRGRFHRTLKMFRKFLQVQRRETGTSAAEGPAEPDSGLTELQAPCQEEHQEEPDVSLGSAEHAQDSDTTMNEDRAKADKAVTEDVAITNANTGETEATANTDSTPTPTLIQELVPEYFRDPCFSSQETLSILGSGLEASQDFMPPQAMVTGAPQPLRPAQCGENGSWGSCSLEERSKFPPNVLQVPAIVMNIHQTLASHDTVAARLKIDIVRLAEEHPADVVLTLLRCAPTCDRAAAIMWKTIGSLGPAVKKVLPTLLCVMEDWPVHSASTSDGDDTDVFALAATLVIWVIVQVPECHEAMILHSSRLFVALLFHIVITTQQMPPAEAGHFWKECQEEHRLTINPSRFAVQTMKALLYQLQCDNVVMAMERKRGWDTLLRAHTQHYAVGLLAREMRRNLVPLCCRIALHLLRHLTKQDPYWDLPFLAFLVEVLECLDLRECGGSVLKVLSRFLYSKCREQRRLALKGLVVLSKNPSMARRMGSLSPRLLELLDDADGEVVSMSLRVFTNVLQHKDILVSSTTAPQLAEALLLLFDHDNSHIQLLSIQLFRKVMELVEDEGKKPLKTIVNKSLYTLLIYCHDENWDVAEASRETLLRVAEFLKRRDLEQFLKKQPPLKVDEGPLAEDTSRAAEHQRRVLRCLQSLQESLREAAFRIMGMPGRRLRRQQEELQLIWNALQARRQGASPSSSNLENQAQFPQTAGEVGTSSGSSEPVSQEQHQETLKRTSPLSTAGAPGTADAGQRSPGFSPLPACS
ncbi:uncharacterized protein LOC135308517 isoform X2 [Passer domesticus]|uniref:uncharacterized protein LOC135308517 isoform X2 n=1 Tax=Passer domesticus TaxID=48849 RepID=UPI0030FE0E36